MMLTSLTDGNSSKKGSLLNFVVNAVIDYYDVYTSKALFISSVNGV